MASNIYLIRKNGNPRSVQYTQVENVYLSGMRTAYAAVSGDAGTGVVTITGSTIADGMQIIFTSLTGGSGVSTGVAYFAVNSSGATCQLATTEGGSAIALGTNITAGSVIVVAQQMRVWSSEFRDIFTPSGVKYGVLQTTTAGSSVNNYLQTMTAATVSGLTYTPGEPPETSGTLAASDSDEIGHHPLRQTFVNRSFWVFDLGSSHQPRYLYAEYQPGDVIANNAPSSY